MRVRKGTGLPANAPYIGADEVYLDEATGKFYRRNPSTGAVEETSVMTGAEIKAAYEAEADTNAFTDAEQAKLQNQPLVFEAVLYIDEGSASISLSAVLRNDTGAAFTVERTGAGNYRVVVPAGYRLRTDHFKRPHVIMDEANGGVLYVIYGSTSGTPQYVTFQTVDPMFVVTTVTEGNILFDVVVEPE